MSRQRAVLFLVVPVCAGLALVAGCREATVDSHWRRSEIVVDGSRREWPDRYYSFDDEKISLGLMNDEHSLYLLVATSNQRLAAQALAQGLQARFRAPKGGGELWIGSTCATGFGPRPGFRRSGEGGDEGGGSPEEREPGQGRRFPGGGSSEMGEDRIREAVKEVPEEVRLYDASGRERLRFSSTEAAARGIEMRPGYDDEECFLYEIKVPLAPDSTSPDAIGRVAPGDLVELTLRIPKTEHPSGRPEGYGRGARRNPAGMQQGPGGFPGRGRRGGYGGGERPSMEMPNGLDLKVKIRLATAQSS